MPGLLAQVQSEFQFGRLADPYMFYGGIVVLVVLAIISIALYIRDSVELSWPITLLLATLRLSALGLLFWIWLQPQMQRYESKVENSQVVMMVDVTASMGHRDRIEGTSTPGPARIDTVRAGLQSQKLVERLQRDHNVTVLRFYDDKLHTVIERPRITEEELAAQESAEDNPTSESETAKPEDPNAWVDSLEPDEGDAMLGETRLGDALRRAIAEYRSGVLAGVVVITDGQSNAGGSINTAVELATDAAVPVFPIGIGSTEQPINVRIDGLNVPRQAYPGDEYMVEGFLLGTGPGTAGRNVTAELVSRPVTAEGQEGTETVEGEEQIVLNPDGEAQRVAFRLQAGSMGRRMIELRIKNPPIGDYNPDDNVRRGQVDIVEQKSKILLFAGGPNRDYQFLLRMLSREARRPNSGVTVDVVLQIAQPGVSQDATKILNRFPTTPAQLAEYDCIVAFDPDWLALSDDQMQALENWVGNQAGGLIVMAGPVHTESWTTRDRAEPIRRLYPIEFQRRFQLLDAGRFENTKPHKVLLTPAGIEANFLWLEDRKATSLRAWQGFEGIYGFYQVKGPKTNATVYARAEEPGAYELDENPVWMADHYYGVGRVFYLGSGEVWRLRGKDPNYLDRIYTKLIRHVTAGRGQAGAKRGVLLVERDQYSVGQMVQVRAQLRSLDQQPLEVPSVDLDVLQPNGLPLRVTLEPSRTEQPGNYVGQFVVREAGDYRLEMQLPDGNEADRLDRVIQVEIPNLELRSLHRNDVVLGELAERTGGVYTVGMESAAELADKLPAKTRTEVQLLRPAPLWADSWVLYVLVGLLGAEWLIRRIVKLA
jgi:hypothetical protein